jgi:hypothetical protein
MRHPAPRPPHTTSAPRAAALLAAAALAALAAPASAVDIEDGKLSIHADGQWAYQRTTGKNAFDEATPAGNYDTAMFDLVLTARPVENLVISAQLGFEPEGTGLEWAFAEWRFSERLRLRMGKVQQPFGNLNELRFAGTTRPFYHLPYSVYGPANVVGTAYYGGGATGQLTSAAGWVLGYDLYVGAVNLEEAEPYSALKDRPPSEPVEVESYQLRDLVGGRLSLTSPGEITARLSGYAGRLSHGDVSESFSSLGGSVQYRGEQLWLSAEAFRSQEGDGEVAWTSYATVGWMVTEHMQAAVQYEWMRTTFPGSPASALLRHQSLGLALAWWVNPSLVFKACWHQIDGNRFAYPEGKTGGELAGIPDPTTAPSHTTGALTLGTQFAF